MLAHRAALKADLSSPDMVGSVASRRLLAVLTAAALSIAVKFRFKPPLAAVDAVASPFCSAARRTVLCCADMSAAERRKLRLVCVTR